MEEREDFGIARRRGVWGGWDSRGGAEAQRTAKEQDKDTHR
jgi:hypothetical protein